MREIILILGILAIIVCASGCTEITQTNKNYSGNGVSFSYPAEWDEIDTAEQQEQIGDIGKVLATVGIEDKELFSIYSITPKEDQKLNTASEWNSNLKTSFGKDYVSDKSIDVDGEKGMQLTAKSEESGVIQNVYYAYWTKKDKGYMVLLVTEKDSQEQFDTIVSTIKTS